MLLLRQQLQAERVPHGLRQWHQQRMLLQLLKRHGPCPPDAVPRSLSLELVLGTQRQPEEAEQVGQWGTQHVRSTSHPGEST